jgi:hypothetical protein
LHDLMHFFRDPLKFIVLHFEIFIIELQSASLALQILDQRTILPQHVLSVQGNFLRSHQVFLHLTLSFLWIEHFILNVRIFKDSFEWIQSTLMVFKLRIDIANTHANLIILMQFFGLFIKSFVCDYLYRKINFLFPKIKLSIDWRKWTFFKILQVDSQTL